MSCAPNVNIFRELQVVHDTGYFSSDVSPEEDWQQVIEGHNDANYVAIFLASAVGVIVVESDFAQLSRFPSRLATRWRST